jgi:hypothetical protein
VRYLRIKNWEEFQHYKDRNPPWIKLHRSLLDDYEFSQLQDASKAHLMLIWLFASQNDGKIPEDARFLQRKLGLEKPPDLKTFIDHGLLIPEQDASNALADGKQDDSDALALARSQEAEKRREEAERAREQFAAFWIAYPRKVAKPDAERAWQKLALHNGDFERVMNALETQKRSPKWREQEGQFIPHPATWLNGRRFEDEADVAQPKRVAL